MEKTCNWCNIIKDTSEFYKDKRATGGFTHTCKDCQKSSAIMWNHNNKERVAKNGRIWDSKNKDKRRGYDLKRDNKLGSGIYMKTNLITGAFYIGSSNQIARRNRDLSTRKIYRVPLLLQAIKKYGVENFKLTIIEYCKKEILFEREKYWIKKLQPDYNITWK